MAYRSGVILIAIVDGCSENGAVAIDHPRPRADDADRLAVHRIHTRLDEVLVDQVVIVEQQEVRSPLPVAGRSSNCCSRRRSWAA